MKQIEIILVKKFNLLQNIFFKETFKFGYQILKSEYLLEGDDLDIRCKDCKHSYSYFKQITNDRGMIDFVTMLKCRLDHEIKEDGTPECADCFEPRNL